MAMRIEYDRESDAIYVNISDGEHARTIEVVPIEIYVDVDSEGRTLGVEFLSFATFSQYIEEHGGLNFPECFTGPESLVPTLA
jgi:uncharacterized protein YuzE